MIKVHLQFAIVLSVLWSPLALIAQTQLKDYQPLIGEYDLIGQKPDSTETYYGSMKLSISKAGLAVERQIGAVKSTGTATFALRGERTQALEIRFSEDTRSYLSSCIMAWDLDNYARLSCRYGVEGVTQKPGLEALFVRHVD